MKQVPSIPVHNAALPQIRRMCKGKTWACSADACFRYLTTGIICEEESRGSWISEGLALYLKMHMPVVSRAGAESVNSIHKRSSLLAVKHCWQFKEEVAKSQHNLPPFRGWFYLKHNFCPGSLSQQEPHCIRSPGGAKKQRVLLCFSMSPCCALEPGQEAAMKATMNGWAPLLNSFMSFCRRESYVFGFFFLVLFEKKLECFLLLRLEMCSWCFCM